MPRGEYQPRHDESQQDDRVKNALETLEAGIDAIRAKGTALTGMALSLADEWLTPAGFDVASPRNPTQRGGHLSITRSDARDLCEQLVANGVLADFRTPDAIRLGLSPLPTSFAEVWDAMVVITDISR